ncbi:hypothetical protein ACMFMF_002358 [Clarireedia jacksonii]
MKNLLSTLFLAAIATGVRAVPVSPNTLDSRSLAAKTAYTVDAYGKEIAAADAVEVLSRGLAVDNMGTKGIAPVLGFGIVHAIGACKDRNGFNNNKANKACTTELN